MRTGRVPLGRADVGQDQRAVAGHGGHICFVVRWKLGEIVGGAATGTPRSGKMVVIDYLLQSAEFGWDVRSPRLNFVRVFESSKSSYFET